MNDEKAKTLIRYFRPLGAAGEGTLYTQVMGGLPRNFVIDLVADYKLSKGTMT